MNPITIISRASIFQNKIATLALDIKTLQNPDNLTTTSPSSMELTAILTIWERSHIKIADYISVSGRNI
ncbi:hypothetical protein AGR3A_Lc140347 [Agrobacterium tomkonis CFBP 6623]|uniref:Uncharacterized protein n=1 Tax=Agrobacterium tomkonis CFBP 6623 TaxID=1183432 RepID=A0A1S7RTK7_9HYPH|nr:hypothetical protein AGR3A_Lc140347 [Agrobacterium tomkonis CFBP 6623]